MKRYQGQELPSEPLIAVVANDAIGNFVVTTPLLQMLRARFAGCKVVYFGGHRVVELGRASDLVEEFYPLHGTAPNQFARDVAARTGRWKFDLIVNVEWTAYARSATAMLAGEGAYVCGPCLDGMGRGDLPFPDDERGALWKDQEWVAPDLTERYPFLKTGFIGEIFCRLAYLEGEVPGYRVPTSDPGRPIPDVLIATAASLPSKLWTSEGWKSGVRFLRDRGLTVGLLGAPVRVQNAFWTGGAVEDELVAERLVEDLRGAFSLPQVVGALSRTKLVWSLDNGILHLAAATDRPTVGLFRHGIHRLWLPPFGRIDVVTPCQGQDVDQIGIAQVCGRLDAALAVIQESADTA